MEGRVDTAEHLRQAFREVDRMQPAVNCVLLTGDLVNNGTPQEYANLGAVMGSNINRVVVVAGNHDDRSELRSTFPQLQGIGSAYEPLHYAVDLPSIGDDVDRSIVVLDTTVPGLHGGELDEGDLRWLYDALDLRRDRQVLIAQHHPPYLSGIDFMDDYCLKGASAEAEVLQLFTNIVGVVCGHLHRPSIAAFGGTIAVTAPSTAAQVSPDLNGGVTAYTNEPGMFAVHRWDAGSFVTHFRTIEPLDAWSPSWALAK